jgi:hypothetical protein
MVKHHQGDALIRALYGPGLPLFPDSAYHKQPGFAKKQPFLMRNCCHRHWFHVGKCHCFPPPGMGRLGRRNSGRNRLQHIEGGKVPSGGRYERFPDSPTGVIFTSEECAHWIDRIFRGAVICCIFWRRNSQGRKGFGWGRRREGRFLGVVIGNFVVSSDEFLIQPPRPFS